MRSKAVAPYLVISQQTYSCYETGQHVIPTWVVTALAKYYKVSADYLQGTALSYPSGDDLQKIYLGDITLLDIILLQ